MQIHLFKTHKLIKTILYILLKREDSFSVLLLKLFGGALLFLLFPISTYSQDFYTHENEDNGITIIGDAKIIIQENTSLKESYTENISKEVSNQTSLKDEAKVVVKEKPLKNSLEQTKKTNSEKYKNIDEKLIKKLEQKREVKIIYNTDAQSEGCLSSNYGTSKSGINNQNQSQKLDKALFTENKPLVFLFIYQEKQNVLFQFYHSLKVENHLFTRPPPTFI